MILAAALPGSADAKINKPRMVGNWLVATITDDVRQFTECSALTDYKNGFVLAFVLKRDLTWAIAFQNNRWQFTPQSQLDVKYKIDAGQIRDASGVVNGPRYHTHSAAGRGATVRGVPQGPDAVDHVRHRRYAISSQDHLADAGGTHELRQGERREGE